MDQLTTDLVNVVGDVVIAAGSIAYSGEGFDGCMSAITLVHVHGHSLPRPLHLVLSTDLPLTYLQ